MEGQATREGRGQGSQLSSMVLWPRASAPTPGLSLLICKMGVAEPTSQGKQVKAGTAAGAVPGLNAQLGRASSSQGPQEVADWGHEGGGLKLWPKPQEEGQGRWPWVSPAPGQQ